MIYYPENVPRLDYMEHFGNVAEGRWQTVHIYWIGILSMKANM